VEQQDERRPWTRDELLLVMNLYCRLPFGKQHARNPEVIQLAISLGRTPGSVAMKLNNFTSLDPAERSRGVKGLRGASKLDKQIWGEFHSDWNALGLESERLWEQVVGDRQEEETKPITETAGEGFADVLQEHMPVSEAKRVVRVRLTQRFFRQTVLASFSERCCITGMPIPQLLEAAHILPWTISPENRNNPRNGLCMTRLHHAAFDAGLIGIDENFRVTISKELSRCSSNRPVVANFLCFEGKAIELPEKFVPDPEFLKTHMRSVFRP
jgi:predicted restriction endonuclease